MRSYETARGYFSFLSFVFWALIALGAAICVISLAAAGNQSGLVALVAAVPGLMVIGAGVFGLIYTQTSRAAVDSAEYAQQALEVSREQLSISKQLLKLAQGEPGAATYASSSNATEGGSELQDISFDTNDTSQATTGADGAPALNAPEVLEVTSFMGEQIERLENGYRVGVDIFPNLPVAQEAIKSPKMRPLLARMGD